MQFAKHQNFHIREGWLRKGMRAILKNPRIFLEENAPDELGIGKNMVSSLRYWMQSTGIAKEEYQMFNGVRQTCQLLTPFGEILNKFDPYFEDEVTLFAVHASLVRNMEMATAWYWLFNLSPQREFDKPSFLTSLENYIALSQEKEIALSSLEKDFNCILRTYLPEEEDDETHVQHSPESLLECPLSTLGLITKIDKDKYRLSPPNIEQFDPILILYVLLSQQQQRRLKQVTVNLYEALYLLALLSKKETNMDAVRIVSERFFRDFPDAGEVIARWLSSDERFLPVVLSGYEGDICTALNFALKRSMTTFGLSHLVLPTAFSAAVNTIENWKLEYPETYKRLEEKLKESHFNGTSESVASLTQRIEHGDINALSFFKDFIYPQLTSGATFDTSAGISPDVVYQHAANSLRQHGYRGIFVLYDEFGRFLERLVSDPHGFDSKLLQDFAEMCDRTSDAQVHLLLVTHKSIGDYLQPLDKNIRDE